VDTIERFVIIVAKQGIAQMFVSISIWANPKHKKRMQRHKIHLKIQQRLTGNRIMPKKANATRAKPVQYDLQTLINRIEEQEKQIAALKASF
jgi:hypothetical protein